MRIIQTTCSRCGSNLNLKMKSNIGYCEYCGNQIIIDFENDNQDQMDQLQFETVTITVYTNMENEKIAEYRKMGWYLKNSEIAYSGGGSSSLYYNKVRLTFQRNKNHRNYQILNQYYREYCRLQDELDNLYCNQKSGVTFLSFLPGIGTIIFSIILFILLRVNRAPGFNYNYFGDSFWPVILFLTATLVALAMLITFPYVQKHFYEKKNDPIIRKESQKIHSKVEKLLSESEKYL